MNKGNWILSSLCRKQLYKPGSRRKLKKQKQPVNVYGLTNVKEKDSKGKKEKKRNHSSLKIARPLKKNVQGVSQLHPKSLCQVFQIRTLHKGKQISIRQAS